MDDLWYGRKTSMISTEDLRTELTKRCGTSRNGSRNRARRSEAWSLEFLRDYWRSDCRDLQALENAIRSTHRPTELQHFLFRVYKKHFTDEHVHALESFTTSYKEYQLVAIHVSCKSRLGLATKSTDSFEQHKDLGHLTVVGQSNTAGKCGYSFDPTRGLLTVPSPDNYEALPLKMAALFRFLGLSDSKACIAKMDDDVRCDHRFSASSLVGITNTYNYVGRIIRPRFGMDRCWHFNKCLDERLNRSPYSMVVDCDYARGHAYFLSERALNILSKATVYLSQSFEIEYYEDVAVGKILSMFGVPPYQYDPFANETFWSDTTAHEPENVNGCTSDK